MGVEIPYCRQEIEEINTSRKSGVDLREIGCVDFLDEGEESVLVVPGWLVAARNVVPPEFWVFYRAYRMYDRCP